MTSVAETIAQTLKAYDTKYFFQVTGGDQPLWIAMEEAGIQMIPCPSEKGATYMAEGDARIRGKTGFVFGQNGLGVSYVAAGPSFCLLLFVSAIFFFNSLSTSSID